MILLFFYRNNKCFSNPDLTNEKLFVEDISQEGSRIDEIDSPIQYYETLPKNLRRGVQKKVSFFICF